MNRSIQLARARVDLPDIDAAANDKKRRFLERRWVKAVIDWFRTVWFRVSNDRKANIRNPQQLSGIKRVDGGSEDCTIDRRLPGRDREFLEVGLQEVDICVKNHSILVNNVSVCFLVFSQDGGECPIVYLDEKTLSDAERDPNVVVGLTTQLGSIAGLGSFLLLCSEKRVELPGRLPSLLLGTTNKAEFVPWSFFERIEKGEEVDFLGGTLRLRSFETIE